MGDDRCSRRGVQEFLAELSRRWAERFPYFRNPVWDERIDAPYETLKPDHDGIRSLVLVAAYLHRPELVRPLTLENYETDVAVLEAGPKNYYMGPMARSDRREAFHHQRRRTSQHVGPRESSDLEVDA